MAGLLSEVDVAVIGAGAAGIAAGRRLAEARRASFVVIEASSPNFFSTAHGAYETGLRATDAALASLGRSSPARIDTR